MSWGPSTIIFYLKSRPRSVLPRLLNVVIHSLRTSFRMFVCERCAFHPPSALQGFQNSTDRKGETCPLEKPPALGRWRQTRISRKTVTDTTQEAWAPAAEPSDLGGRRGASLRQGPCVTVRRAGGTAREEGGCGLGRGPKAGGAWHVCGCPGGSVGEGAGETACGHGSEAGPAGD